LPKRSLLLETKKIKTAEDFGQVLRTTRLDLDLHEAVLDWKVVHELRFVMLGYNDPADRFLAATAKACDMALITADQRLLQIPGLRTIPNL
jgi:PIN domain nuclease of toxin-antitoxin system